METVATDGSIVGLVSPNSAAPGSAGRSHSPGTRCSVHPRLPGLRIRTGRRLRGTSSPNPGYLLAVEAEPGRSVSPLDLRHNYKRSFTEHVATAASEALGKVDGRLRNCARSMTSMPSPHRSVPPDAAGDDSDQFASGRHAAPQVSQRNNATTTAMNTTSPIGISTGARRPVGGNAAIARVTSSWK